MDRKVVVIGGGPAGIEAAKAAAAAGATVTLVSDSAVGGRAGWHSLLPSKVWLTAADVAGLFDERQKIGLSADSVGAEPGLIIQRIKTVKESWQARQVSGLDDLGVKVVTGVGSFAGPNDINVTDRDGAVIAQLHPDATIIAGGSVPFFPENLRPDGQRVLAPRFASHMDNLPASIVVIGAGATGTETVYMFNGLGVDVTWIVDQFGVLPTFARAAGEFLAETLTRRHVKVVNGLLADHIDRDAEGATVVLSDGSEYRAEMAFVAIGRFPDLSRLNLEAAGLEVEPGRAPAVDVYGQTAVDSIYAVGDAAGAPMLANQATAEAWIAGRHAAGAEIAPFRPETVIHAIYSEPQVAQIGNVAGNDLGRVRVDYAEALKSHLVPDSAGFVELVFDQQREITGAVAVGPHAADVLAPVAVAIRMGARLDEVAPIFAAHPTLSELVFIAARSA